MKALEIRTLPPETADGLPTVEVTATEENKNMLAVFLGAALWADIQVHKGKMTLDDKVEMLATITKAADRLAAGETVDYTTEL